VKGHCQAVLLGALPRDAHISMPSRHLGLHMGSEMQLNIERMAAMVEEHIDLDRLLELTDYVSQPVTRNPEPVTRNPQPNSVRLGLAWDEAFCFYYQDNLDMLKQAGAELMIFSPLSDTSLPDGLDGIYLGGGYPELHAARLAANEGMRTAICDFALSGRPVYGECGGFMYLCREIADQKGGEHAMAGIFPVRARMGGRLRRLGYRRVELASDCLLGQAGTFCYGHEFHYSDIETMPEQVERVYRLDDGRAEGYRMKDTNTLAGYVHLHWGRTPEAAAAFVRAMRANRGEET
jgi:cobyrinic acid a,c-diamide synthase